MSEKPIPSAEPLGQAPGEILEEIAALLAVTQCELPAISLRLRDVEALLESRFADEETGQHEEAILQAPWLTPDVQWLKGQHDELLDRLRRLIQQADEPQETPETRRQWRYDFDELATRYLEHEANEDTLLQDLYYPDRVD